MEIKWIVQTCKGREHYIPSLVEAVPNLIVNFDDFTDSGKFCSTAWQNYLRGLELAGDYPTVQMEDDIILCEDFYNKVLKNIEERPDDVIQFFSMRKDDLTIGSRYILGSKYLMNQCYYLPSGLAKRIREAALEYEKQEVVDKYVPSDTLMANFLKRNKIKYWNVVPNLVDHIEGISAIDKKRSSKRQSFTFRKD